MRAAVALACLLFVTVDTCASASAPLPTPKRPPTPSPAGLVPLPCDGSEPLRPAHGFYCLGDRNYVTPQARQAIIRTARAVHKAYPDTVVTFMDASWPSGKKPFPPHLSHGDGRQIDLALFYESKDGRRLPKPPGSINGYEDFEPRPVAEPDPCPGKWKHRRPDPPKSRTWRLDEGRSEFLTRTLIKEGQVRRVLIEPHLEKRFGLWGNAKARFQGCHAARHDDHLHVDFR
ncbi:hypothetical protein [Caulobacter sp. 17J65-9]|uniref:hypothetical protein n=1 Tax=Caulobacter sp. 17J65-9 TaxID=2709382 RepID=UPI0013C66AB7|nr:hypothetical protein [Caulobacter sp. 17J65-9]NEX91666.1 hypothetical protein [Caulobacter sp. 17J65-9]